ncbi:hypothetical protein D9619_003899 [Psilocybe cf. subviscida]|uniref:Uncharacterized protein n=1 Tax=Psilocybe cf. subviscida TaxID=2480587 RepID=A0A8H5BRS2_9AGAR|nr:hypothetical protein D9619_003899 [Psilocybe cf. subviscida]
MNTRDRKRKGPLLRRGYDFVLLKEFNSSETNVLIFSSDGKYLISGCDDETVKVWNTETFECEEVVGDDEWGIITALTLTYRVQPLGTHSRNIPVLLAVCSHSGALKVFELEKTTLTPLWTASFNDSIPAGIFFYGSQRESLLTLGLNTSELCSRDAKTGSTLWTTKLRGGIGGSALANDDTTLLVNNLSTGNFDLYHIPDETPLRSLPVLSIRRFTKQCSFLEGSTRLALCGGDTNTMSVIDLSRDEIIASLQTGTGLEMTQTVAVSPTTAPRVLLAGTSGGSIFVWEKIRVKEPSFIQSFTSKTKASYRNAQSDTNIKLLIVFVLVVTYANWAPPLVLMLNGIMDRCKSLFSLPDDPTLQYNTAFRNDDL